MYGMTENEQVFRPRSTLPFPELMTWMEDDRNHAVLPMAISTLLGNLFYTPSGRLNAWRTSRATTVSDTRTDTRVAVQDVVGASCHDCKLID